MTRSASSNRLTARSKSKPYGARFSRSPLPSPRMNRPPERWLSVTADCASITGWRRTVSTTLVAIATRRVSAATAPATASASRWRCGECDTSARSVNSGVQIASGQKLTR